MAHDDKAPRLRSSGPLTAPMLADLEGFERMERRSKADHGSRKGLIRRGLVERRVGFDWLTFPGRAALDVCALVRGIYRRRIAALEEVDELRKRDALDAKGIEAAESIGGPGA